MICPHCSANHSRKNGIRKSQKGVQQIWKCKNCGKKYQTPKGKQKMSEFSRILLLDIETSLYHFTGWGTYKQYIDHYRITKNQFIISWAAKWLYDDLQSQVVTPKEARNRDDERIVQGIWELLDQAHIVIGHNADRFDLRKLKWRFISLGMQPPSPYRIIDTLKVAKKEFASPSYKQDFLTKYFKIEEKLSTNYDLWVGCEAGDQESLNKMEEYNRHDVLGLEELYLKVRPYIKNHPNLGVLLDEDVCPNCGSEHLTETDSIYFTSANRFPVFRCDECTTPYIRHKKNSNHVQTNIRSVAL